MAYSKQPKALITNEGYHAVLSTKFVLKKDLTTGGGIVCTLEGTTAFRGVFGRVPIYGTCFLYLRKDSKQ